MSTKQPIFLIGAARSGTTIIADTLAAHPDVAFWSEPKYVWRAGNHGAPDDARDAAEATPAVAARIRATFERFRRRAGRPRFLEKTPSNCFRVEFMHRVFPEGLFLHVQRDGRDAAASALRRWCAAPDDRAILRRMRRWEIPLAATHHYLPDILRELVARRLRPGQGHVWGPRYPGLREDLRRGLDVATLCARQWVASERAASAGLARVPRGQVLRFRYESFAREPEPTLARVLAFCGLPDASAVREAAQAVRAERIGTWQGLPPAQRAAIEAECALAMAELGL